MENIVKPVACKIRELSVRAFMSIHLEWRQISVRSTDSSSSFPYPKSGKLHLGELLWGRLDGFHHPFRGQGDGRDI